MNKNYQNNIVIPVTDWNELQSALKLFDQIGFKHASKTRKQIEQAFANCIPQHTVVHFQNNYKFCKSWHGILQAPVCGNSHSPIAINDAINLIQQLTTKQTKEKLDMKVQIKYTEDESNYEWETIQIAVDGQTITQVTTVTDCPEDNTISRLNLVNAFNKVVEALGHQVENIKGV